jgi:hypothetical protein
MNEMGWTYNTYVVKKVIQNLLAGRSRGRDLGVDEIMLINKTLSK